MYFDYKPVISINFCSFVSTSQKKKKKKGSDGSFIVSM